MAKSTPIILASLTDEEARVLVGKATESPFSGEYNDFWQPGTYVCRRCNTPLYGSRDKFDAHCGWPAFDQELAGAVIHTPEPEGLSTEISCAACGAHLGHVFTGEGLTPTNTRHCVNSLSLKFLPDKHGH